MHLFGVGHTDDNEGDFMGSFPLIEVVLVVSFLESRFRIANSSKNVLTVDIRIPNSVIHIRRRRPAEPFSTFNIGVNIEPEKCPKTGMEHDVKVVLGTSGTILTLPYKITCTLYIPLFFFF